MATITKPYTFSNGAIISAAEHNSNFDTLYTDYNGNITNANIKATAAIAASKLDLSNVTITGGSVSGLTTFQTTDPWKDVRQYASINAAVTTLGSTVCTLLIPSAQTLTASLTIPSTMTLKILQGGSIVKASTYTLTINGPFEAGLYQVFSGFSDGNITFGTGKVNTVYPEWFGAAGDGSTNDYTAIQSALSSLVSGQTLLFTATSYKVSTASQACKILTDGVTVQGTRGTSILVDGMQSGFVIGNNDALDDTIYGDNATIVTNGTFTSDTTSWTAVNSTIASVASGQSGNCLEITRTSGTTQTAKQGLTTVANKWYIISVWVKSTGLENFQISLYDVDTTEIKTSDGTATGNWEEYFFAFKAASTATTLRLVRNSSAAGTMLFDTVSIFPVTSDVTIRDFNFKCTTTDAGNYGIWVTFANNCLIENVSGGNISAIIAVGNDATDTCANITINNVFSTGDINHGDFYSVGIFRLFGGFINNLHLTGKGGASHFIVHDSYDVHMSNIHTKFLRAIEFTRIGRCTLNGFSVDGGNLGINVNNGVEGIGNSQMKYNIYSNGIIRNTTDGISVYGIKDIYSNIITIGCTNDITIYSGASLNKFIGNNFTGGVLVDGSSLVTHQGWYLNSGINEGLLMDINERIGTLADSATPSVDGFDKFLTGGTTTITDLTNGWVGKVITIISEHAITITDGTNIFLSGSTNFVMAATDTLTLICKADLNWYEISRSDNT